MDNNYNISEWCLNGKGFSSQEAASVLQTLSNGKAISASYTQDKKSWHFGSSPLPSFIFLQNCDGNPLKDSITHVNPQQAKMLWIPTLSAQRLGARHSTYQIPRGNFYLQKFYFFFPRLNPWHLKIFHVAFL